jgi:hypothetical protein
MKARHLAGSMCRFAVQRVLDRPLWNISALARASTAAATASSRSTSRWSFRSAATSRTETAGLPDCSLS